MQAQELRFFGGLDWAVPTAFAAALAGFRFEQGDVLYRAPEAYSALEEAPPTAGIALQILHPPRSARSTPADFDGNRRRTSWESEVRLQRIELASGHAEDFTVSQGKLLMTLWTGDEDWLDGERGEPAMPGSGRALASYLETAGPAFAAALKLSARAKACRFLFVVDLASDASRVKAQSIAEALAPLGACEALDLTPAAAGVVSEEPFHPVLVLRAIRVTGTTEEDVENALRGALYGGGNRSKAAAATEPAVELEDGEEGEEGEDVTSASVGTSTAGRFSVARHGLLVATARAAKVEEAAESQ